MNRDATTWIGAMALVVAMCACGDGEPGVVDAPAADAPEIDGPILPSTCSPTAQDCPTGYKCSFVVDGILVHRCRPLTGNLVEGAACTGVDGDDDCGPGLLCADDRCQRFCESGSDCAAAQGCAFYRTGDGLCQDACTLFDASSCPANNTCDLVNDRGFTTTITFCRKIGASTDACLHGPGSPLRCPRDSGCDVDTCAPLCDLSHPCSAGTCTQPDDFPDNPTQAGICR